MSELESKNEKPNKERRFSQEQYDRLKRCSDKEDMTEWNEWRKKNPQKDICLDDKNLNNFYLQQANFMKGTRQENGVYTEYSGEIYLRKASFRDAKIQGASFSGAHLEETTWYYAQTDENTCFSGAFLNGANFYGKFDGCNFSDAILIEATLSGSSLKGAKFMNSDLRGCHAREAIVDGHTIIFKPKINRFSKSKPYTDFEGVSLDIIRIYSATKQLLEYNIRRKNWEEWYKEHCLLRLPVWLFWLISDYGLRSWRIIVTFFGLAFAFGVVYWLWPSCVMVNKEVGDIRGLWHALYFSVVTMTTLGFGDIAANPDSWAGQTLLMLQVILGYVLLGALVTRFAVLFTAGGPAGKFADDKEKKDETE